MTFPLILIGTYIFIMPIVFRLLALAHKKLITQRKIDRLPPRTTKPKDMPTPIWRTWKERLRETIRDKNNVILFKKVINIQNRMAFLILWAIGLLIVTIGAFINTPTIYGIGFLWYFVVMAFGIHASKATIAARKKMFQRMFAIATKQLGISSQYEEQPSQVIEILEYREPSKPSKIIFKQIPETFAEEGEEGFLKQFNQIFGQETTWVPFDDKETGKPGWNYEEATVTINAVPPLPTMAKWTEHYILNDKIAWSFFPIALGVENGVELDNPATGEIENVLGFDVSGLQSDKSKEYGLKQGGEITTSPMCITGDSLILTDNGPVSIKYLADNGGNAKVISYDMIAGFELNNMFGIQKTRADANILEIILTNGSSFKCTPDHLCLTRSGFVQAENMLNKEIVAFGQVDQKVIDILPAGKSDVYDGEVENNHNFVLCSSAKRGVVLRNCFIGGGTGGGKSLASDTIAQVIKPQVK